MCAHDIPMKPWAKVGTDLFSFNNRAYLITVDYFSNCWETDSLPDTSSSTVIHKLKAKNPITEFEFETKRLSDPRQYISKKILL